MLKKLWETFEWHSLPKNINNAWTERERSVPSGALGTLICIRCLPKFISERLLSVQRIIRWVKYGWINPFWGFPGGSDGKVCPQCGRPGFDPWIRKISWRRKWQVTPVFLPGKSHGQRSLVGYSPWCPKESDMTELLHFHLQTLFLESSCMFEVKSLL